MPERELPLLTEAARAAGEIALRYWRTDQEVRSKGEAGPVSEGDIAVDTYLRETLLAARPDYGWLSEETEDTAERLDRERVFIVDPIDGTRAYVDGQETWAVSIGLVEHGQPIAGVVYLPKSGKLYAATLDGGATLNDTPIHCAPGKSLAGATVLAAKPMLDGRHWKGPVPALKRHFRPSLAYRLCLVAEGRFDAMLTVRPTWDWDIAAGALIAAEAGASVSDANGKALVFNGKAAQNAGTVTARKGLHGALIKSLRPVSG